MKEKAIALALASVLALTGCRSSISSPDGPTVFPDETPVGGETVPEQPDPPAAPESVTTEQLLADIAAAAPGAAGSALRGIRAAGELLDWADQAGEDTPLQAEQWISREIPAESALDLALAWEAVLDQAAELLDQDTQALELLEEAGYQPIKTDWDPQRLETAARSLRTLFTYLLETRTPVSPALPGPGDYAAVTPEKFEGVWVTGEANTLLLFSGDTCRVVYPALNLWGETAYAFRIRDRSAVGYCPALEIDFKESGDFSGALVYYVSGIDGEWFWCIEQQDLFVRLA